MALATHEKWGPRNGCFVSQGSIELSFHGENSMINQWKVFFVHLFFFQTNPFLGHIILKPFQFALLSDHSRRLVGTLVEMEVFLRGSVGHSHLGMFGIMPCGFVWKWGIPKIHWLTMKYVPFYDLFGGYTPFWWDVTITNDQEWGKSAVETLWFWAPTI